MKRELILAIETGIGGGSLSIFDNDFEIDFWEGAEKIAKSEELLSNISRLLLKNRLAKRDINKLVVSIGPGSYTGVRTGISTVKGLQKALKCECFGISILEAMVLKTKRAGRVSTGFATGKNEICWQIFETDGAGIIRQENSPQIEHIKEFLLNSKKNPDTVLILYKDLFKKVLEYTSESDFAEIELLEAEESAAKYLALRSQQTSQTFEILPVYARDARIF